MKKNILIFLLILQSGFPVIGQEVLSLDESRKLALEYNHRIKIANELISENESNVNFAFAQFFPHISIGGNYNFYHDIDDMKFDGYFLKTANSLKEAEKGIFTGTSDVYFPGMDIKLGDIDYYSGNINFSQPLFHGGKIQTSYKISKLGKDISVFNNHLQKSDVLQETDQAYWHLVSLKEKVKLVSRYVEMLSALVTDLQNTFDLELTTKNELLKAKVQLNQSKLDLFRTKNQEKLSKMSLCQLIGKKLNSNIVLTDTSIVVNNELIENNYLDKALTQRPELLMLEKNVEISRQEKNITKADYLPQIDVTGSYSYISEMIDMIDSQKILMLQGTISMPVFHWRERKHKVSMAKFRLRQKELELDRKKDLVSLEVQQAYFNLQEAYQQIELAKTSMSQANENVNLTKNSFYEGLTNTTELLDAQTFWQQAHSELIDAKINYKLREVSFKKSIGDLGI